MRCLSMSGFPHKDKTVSQTNFWNERYAAAEYAYGTQPNDFLVSSLNHLPKSGRVLCLGDGEGRNGVYLATQGHDVTSVDMSQEAKRKAEALAQQHNVQLAYIVADLTAYDLGEAKWDAIISIFCHLPKPLREQVHERAAPGLKPGGVFLLEAYSPQQLQFNTGGPKELDMLMALGDVKRELHGLDFTLADEKTRNVMEGKFHHGTAAVIRLIATKPNISVYLR